jgi:hypothetical protein
MTGDRRLGYQPDQAVCRPCPVLACRCTVTRGKLMCIGHWQKTPRELQAAVNRTWRELRRVDRGDRLAHLAAIRTYRAAAEAAIAAAAG